MFYEIRESTAINFTLNLMLSEEEYTVAAAQQNSTNKQQNISNELILGKSHAQIAHLEQSSNEMSNHSGCRDVSTNDDDEADGNQLQIGSMMLDKSSAAFTLA